MVVSIEITQKLKPILELNKRLTHRQVDTGVGTTTPAVYIAWKMPFKCVWRVTSLINKGARRFERNRL